MALAFYLAGPLVLAFLAALALRWYGNRYGFTARVTRSKGSR
jgi:hypothetical protein